MRADELVEVIQALDLRQLDRAGGELEGDDALDRAVGILQHGDRLGGEGRHDHDGLRAAVVELACQLGHRVERVGGDFDRADLPHRVHGQQVLRHVRGHDGHAVALLDAEVEEGVRETAGHVVAVGVGKDQIAEHRVGLHRVLLRPVVEPPLAGLVFVLDLLGDLRVVLLARQRRVFQRDFVEYFQVVLVCHFCYVPPFVDDLLSVTAHRDS